MLWYNSPMKSDGKVLILVGIASLFTILLNGCNAITLPELESSPKPAAILSPLPSRTSTPTPADLRSEEEIPTPTPTLHLYSVKKDELGWSIAARFKVTLPLLQAANPGVDLNFLKEGTELIIPPPVDTPSPILYTPTPVMLSISPVRCYPNIEKDLWCLVNLNNQQATDVYYLTGEFRLSAGGQVFSKSLAGLADRLPAGGRLPLIAFFKGPFQYPINADFSLLSAFTAEQVNVTPLLVENLTIEYDTERLWAAIQGDIVNPGGTAVLPAVIASAYQGELPAGIRKLELTEVIRPGERIPFSLEVYSTGPRIDQVDVLAEGR